LKKRFPLSFVQKFYTFHLEALAVWKTFLNENVWMDKVTLNQLVGLRDRKMSIIQTDRRFPEIAIQPARCVLPKTGGTD